GRDDDDAVGTACAVDRRRGRVLQDFDRLDVVRVQGGERIRRHCGGGVAAAVARILIVRIVLDREAVDDVERLVVAVDGGAATNTNGQRGARRRGRRRDRNAGSGALQGLLE